MNPTRTGPGTLPNLGIVRAHASWFIDQQALPRHQTVRRFGADFRRYLELLTEQTEQLARTMPPDDVPARVAEIAVGEARRRLYIPERDGLTGETERVKRLARSVMALCDHFETLRGLVMCLACDQPIEAADAWPEYDPPDLSGRIHRACRRPRHRV
ncbi:DUF6415 family natural product biosynthesis protein [Streptomyces sp. NPDC004610]|uniref:DUF6415 family natural product biosynthesis protein n=1 Tax=unclassified Streptomyces TaxID=2593676 RepID=UPI0033BB6762